MQCAVSEVGVRGAGWGCGAGECGSLVVSAAVSALAVAGAVQ